MPLGPAQAMAPVAPAQAMAPVPGEEWTFRIADDDIPNLLGPKGGLAAITTIGAVNAYNAQYPDHRINLSGLDSPGYGNCSAVYRKHLRDQIQGKIRITVGDPPVVLFGR